MNRKNVPAKTSEGVLEIKARRLGLAPRIRTALLLVDGIKSTAELERLMTAAGVTPGALQLLLDKGLIHFPEAEPESVEPAITESEAPAVAPALSSTPIPEPSAVRARPAALEVATLAKLKTILGGATKLEIESILDVATILELAPAEVLNPHVTVSAPISEPIRLPPVATAVPDSRVEPIARKAVVPASVLRMNLIVVRAHLANALDQFLGIDGYLLKQKVAACESRAELEKLFRQVESALIQKIDKTAVACIMEIAHALLER